jgi:hypothetical protein
MQSNSAIVSAASSSIRSPPDELRDGDAAHLVGGGSVWLLEEPRIQSPRSLARIGNVVAALLVLYTLLLSASLLVPIAAAVLLSLLLERARFPHAVRRMGTGGYRALATPRSE